jgi:hypothetical protein
VAAPAGEPAADQMDVTVYFVCDAAVGPVIRWTPPSSRSCAASIGRR